MPAFAPDVLAFLGGPNSVMVASRDEALDASLARAVGLACEAGEERVTVYVPDVAGARLLADARAGRPVAVAVNRLTTHRTLQLKGTAARVRPAREDERARVEAYWAGFVEDCALAGLPRALVARAVRWPASALELQVAELYEQTPGPGAGERVRGGGRP